MPPRIRLSLSVKTPSQALLAPARSIPPLLLFLQAQSPRASQARSASILSSISDNPGAYQKPIRRGRGPSSGKGKTSGRGHKGQKQHGKVPFGFEGGQTPLRIVHGERGFKNVFSVDMQLVPLSRIQSWIAQGRIDPTKPITVRELAISRCVSGIKDGVKLLASSHSHTASIDEVPPLTQPLHIVVSRASASAIAAVEKAGGTVTTRYYTQWAIQRIIRGTMDPINSLQSNALVKTPTDRGPAELEKYSSERVDPPPSYVTADATPSTHLVPWATPALPVPRFPYRLPDPAARKAIEYYRDSAHRGYLSYQVPEGQGPSLFFKAPSVGVVKKRVTRKSGSAKAMAENRLW